MRCLGRGQVTKVWVCQSAICPDGSSHGRRFSFGESATAFLYRGRVLVPRNDFSGWRRLRRHLAPSTRVRPAVGCEQSDFGTTSIERQDFAVTFPLKMILYPPRVLSTASIAAPELKTVDLSKTQTFAVDNNATSRKRRWNSAWRQLIIDASPYNQASLADR